MCDAREAIARTLGFYAGTKNRQTESVSHCRTVRSVGAGSRRRVHLEQRLQGQVDGVADHVLLDRGGHGHGQMLRTNPQR